MRDRHILVVARDQQLDPVNPDRRYLCAGTLVALAIPRVVVAQPSPRIRRIGELTLGAQVTVTAREQLLESLLRLGWEQDKNLLIVRRHAASVIGRLDALAAELARLRVELIMATGNPATMAARRATQTIPIVMIGGWLPVEFGLVESLARPGGNVTGTAVQVAELFTKTFQFVRELAPARTRIAWLSGPVAPGSEQANQAMRGEISAAAQASGMTIQWVDVRTIDDLGGALERIAASRTELLYVGAATAIYPRLNEITDFAIRNKILSAATFALFISANGAVYYGPNVQDLTDRSTSFVDRILRGAKPGDLPVELPTKYEMILNLKALRAIGISVPNHVLLQATKVIE